VLVILVLVRRVDNHAGVLPILVYGPVEDVVVPEGLAYEETTEHLAQAFIVRLVVKRSEQD
jgi:hypothetical protein